MSNRERYLITLLEFILIGAMLIGAFVFMQDAGLAEEAEEIELQPLYVMTKVLYGRIRPGKKYQAVCQFELGTPIMPTGRVSQDHLWIEICSAENDIVWCHIDYLSETKEVIRVFTLNDKIKIRKYPGIGKVTGYAKKGQIIEITQVVMGYGKCSRGWVDLSYFLIDCE